MPALVTTARRGTPQDRLGLPVTRGNRPLLGAATVDSLGTGLVVAFVVVYFVSTTTLSLTAVGAAVSLARLLASPTAVLVGPLVDRFGPRWVALVGNAVSSLAYAGFLVSGRFWEIVLVGWLAQVGAVTYWTSSTGLVALASSPEARPRWFALLHSLRNAGLAAGGAVGAFAVGAAGTDGLRAVVVGNAVSYVAAAALLAWWRPVRSGGTPVADGSQPVSAHGASTQPEESGYRTVLRDRRYLLMIAVNLTFTFPTLVPALLLAVYVTQGLHRSAWIAGVLLVANGVQVVLTQTVVTRRMSRYRATRVVACGAGLYALASAGFALLPGVSGLPGAPGWVVPAGLLVAIVVYNLAETVEVPFREELSVALAPEHLRGRYLAVYQLSWTVGQTGAPALFTLLLAGGAGVPWIFLILLGGLSVFLLSRLGRVAPAAL